MGKGQLKTNCSYRFTNCKTDSTTICKTFNSLIIKFIHHQHTYITNLQIFCMKFKSVAMKRKVGKRGWKRNIFTFQIYISYF